MSKKIKVEFERSCEPEDLVIDNALMTQLMVQIAQVGLRSDFPESFCSTIEKEKENGTY